VRFLSERGFRLRPNDLKLTACVLSQSYTLRSLSPSSSSSFPPRETGPQTDTHHVDRHAPEQRRTQPRDKASPPRFSPPRSFPIDVIKTKIQSVPPSSLLTSPSPHAPSHPYERVLVSGKRGLPQEVESEWSGKCYRTHVHPQPTMPARGT
jgi:hypothetical protein